MKYAFDFDTLYRHVGMICVHATWLEQELEDTVTLLAGDDRVASVVRGQRGSNSANAIKRLLKDGATESEHADRIAPLVTRASRALEDRDTIVHSVWLKKNGSRAGYILGTVTRAAKTTHKEWSFEMLDAVRAEMQTVQSALGAAAHNAVAAERGWAVVASDDDAGHSSR